MCTKRAIICKHELTRKANPDIYMQNSHVGGPMTCSDAKF